MALGVSIGNSHRRGIFRGARPFALLGLALASASCVPTFSQTPPSLTIELPTAMPVTAQPRIATSAAAAPEPAGLAAIFRGHTPLDRLRAHDCLAQAIYYEAASETESGQRAVAQVVLNRVRHPAWPDSICGVVYQGPMRPGGGCQFTFTCDGSLARRPAGIAWARARLLAREALSGGAFEPVGLSTHYHTHAVSPAWAPGLRQTIAIGAHIFYRLPGGSGEPRAFADAYSGSEPLPRATVMLPRRTAVPAALEALLVPTTAAATARTTAAADPAPGSSVREEYRHSGQWRADAPAAITGR
jgi:hypothetical protein